MIFAEQLDLNKPTITEDIEIIQKKISSLGAEIEEKKRKLESKEQTEFLQEEKVPSKEQHPEPNESKIIEERSKSQIEKDKSKEQESIEKSLIIKENIIKNVELTLANGDTLPERMPHPSERILNLSIKYEFKLPKNHKYGAGATYTFNLPDAFQMHHQINGDLINGTGTTFGQYKLFTDGTVTMTFNKEIEKVDNVSGFINIQTEIREDLSGSTSQVIEFPIHDNKTVTYPIQFEPKKGLAIEKNGTPDKSYNAQTITWELDINKNLQPIKSAELHDSIGRKQNLVADSITIYELDVQLDGSVKLGKQVTDSLNKSFPLLFGDIDQAYRVVFETMITDETNKEYHNEATLTGQNIEAVSTKATVSVKRGEPLKKHVVNYNTTNQTITWEVKYNYNEQFIEQDKAFLVNTFDDEQALVANSVKVEEVEIKEDGSEGKSGHFSNFDTNVEENMLTLRFKQDINQAYKVTYQTKMTNRVEENRYVTNCVKDGNGHEENARQWMTQQVFNKYHLYNSTNYKDKTTKWGIYINRDAKSMRHVVMTDVLPKGLILEDYTVLYDGKRLGENNYVFKYDRQTGEIRVQFVGHLNTVTKPIYIEYTTSFNFNQVMEGRTSFLNKATLTWRDTSGKDKTLQDSALFTPNRYTQENGFKKGFYNAESKEITWEVGVNYNNHELTQAAIENVIQPQQNINLDSIEVYKVDITPSGQWIKNNKPLKLNQDYEVDLISDSSFKVELGEINEPYIIVYRTHLEGQKIVPYYQNRSILKNGEVKLSESQALASIPNGGKYTLKEATQNKDNPRVLNWKVSINPTQSTLSKVLLTDQPSVNQMVLKDSFQLFDTIVDKNGNISKNTAQSLIKGKDYQVIFKKNEQGQDYFELIFEEKINRPYILEYDTYIMAGNNEYVYNKASLAAHELTDEETTTEHRHRIKLTDSDGGIESRIGHLDITKVDARTKRPLKGAEFTLFDREGEIKIGSVKTNDEGKASFKHLLFGSYIIKETEAPEGYVPNKEHKKITLDQETYQLTVENEKVIQAIEFKNIDAESKKPIGGAIFNLERKVDGQYESIALLTANQDGMIYKNNLKPGKYRFLEKQAAPGYQTNNKPIPFTIKHHQTKATRVISENLKLGSVELTKFNADDKSEVLKDAKFKLLDADGTVIHASLRTNDVGKIVVSHLQPGIYQFVEVKAPDYFILDPTPIEFEVKAKETATVKVNAPNHLLTGKVVLNLVDKEDNRIKLPGAIYKLVQEDGQVIKKHLLTDENGQIIVKDLKPGNYELIQIQAPKHYQSSKEKYKFTIDRNKTDKDKNTVEINAKNKLIPGAVEVVKVDKANHKLKLQSGIFELQDQQGHLIKKDLVTDRHGRLFITNLRPGIYQLVETKAPFGYQLDSEPIQFEINKSQRKPTAVIVKNELITGSVMLSLVDKGYHHFKLKGAVFELRDIDGHLIKSGLTTDQDGVLFVEGLHPGIYQLIEVLAPFGYQLDSTPIQFEIIKGQVSPLKLRVQKRLSKEERIDIQNTIKLRKQNKSAQTNDENQPIKEQDVITKDKLNAHTRFSDSQILDVKKDKDVNREKSTDNLATKSTDHTEEQQSIFDERSISYILFSGSVLIILAAVFLYFRVK